MTAPSNTDLREAIRPFIRHLNNQEAALDTIMEFFQAREQQAIPKFSDMPEGNADFMEGYRAACLQMEANLNKTNDGGSDE